MKGGLLVICALDYGFLPAVAEFQNPALIVLLSIFLGLIYFVFHRHDRSPLAPWLFACVAVGRVAAYWWMNLRHGRVGPVFDSEVWIFGGLAAAMFAFMFWKSLRGQNETSASASPKSTS